MFLQQGGESPLASHSPLKQALPLFEAPEEDLYFWATPNPFALRTQAPPQAYPPSTVQAPPADATAFCTSASEFALPSTSSRSRNPSTDDDADAALSSSNASLASSKGSFDDSSFASDSPGDSSLPSTSSSPHSPPPPYTPSLLAAAATSSSSRGRTTLVLTTPSSMRPPSLRRSSSCGGCSPMLTESNTLPPVWGDPVVASSDELGQAESLHRAAFEQLRHATHAEGEGFVERMRRWETERSARDALFGLGGGAVMQQSRTSDLAPSIGSGHDRMSGGGDDDDDDNDDEDLCEDDDDDDEIDILLDPLDGDMLEFAPVRPPVQRVSHAELDELAQRLRTGACEVEDYALVRDVQARYRTRTRSVA